MKKSLIALAVLAASGAAMAQSSVTLYGVADIVVHKDKGASTMMTSSGASTSRLGFKGTEDLGGGLKAHFVFEKGLDLTNGADNGGFDRQAYLALSGGFGEVQLGNAYTSYENVAGINDPALDANVIDPTSILASRLYRTNPGSNISYISPSFGGFTGGVSYSLDGSKNEVVSFNLGYANGPLSVNLGYQDQEDFAAAVLADTNSPEEFEAAFFAGNVPAKFTTLNASYDFGAFTLLGGYGRVNSDLLDTDATDYFIGANMPVASNIVLSAGYAVSDVDGLDKSKAFGIAAAYLLSKRTTAYAGIRSTNQAAVDNGVSSTKSRFGVGIRHTF